MSVSNGYVSEEATGIYEGTLLEDMIDTVRRTGKLVCDVEFPDIFDKDVKYPYVYVPFWAMTLPLKKGDKVQVIFNQGDYQFPVLYKNPTAFDDENEETGIKFAEGFMEDFDFADTVKVQGGNVKLPKKQSTFFAQWLGDDSYIIKTNDKDGDKGYTLIHQNDGFILLTTDNKIYVCGSEINLSANGNLNVDCAQELKVKSTQSIELEGSTSVTIKSGSNSITMGQDGVDINGHLSILPASEPEGE